MEPYQTKKSTFPGTKLIEETLKIHVGRRKLLSLAISITCILLLLGGSTSEDSDNILLNITKDSIPENSVQYGLLVLLGTVNFVINLWRWRLDPSFSRLVRTLISLFVLLLAALLVQISVG